ncbi:colanic acid biosynthesis glycosyltransferase WcaL [Phragmitibacter flavus]|uniref:Colanic acid biosynthesis glycosyltransferase WcaL n=1 Tax=Phragmitibacter flavus TaxID=2576071 RepID=A0A5R8KDL1_9BACT|nr:glycosyltransferase [Phragmitibacter flavus]TLD70390.1 colanic acid biosynthesis glycosyltransferase WcaL [Phragmitibacter flavus]
MPPSVASYVVDFLKPEMLHIYRQIAGQKNVTPWVLTHKRENAEYFPFPEKRLVVFPKTRLRWWRRLVHKHFIAAPWQIYRWELHHLLLTLVRTDAKLLHIYFGHMALHLLPLIKTFPKPVVVSYHGADAGIDTHKPARLAAMREVFRFATQIQARSNSLANDLIALGCPPEKIHIQRTGIPLNEWHFKPRTPPDDGAWQLIQTCRLIPKKGLDLTLNAFAQIKQTYPKATLTIAGEGPLLAELQQLAQTLNIADSVHFTGFLQQEPLRQLVQSAHLFLHPSRTGTDGNREGVPNSMLEAMASGCPVIATHHGGIPEAITHNHSGLLIEENDQAALTQSIQTLLSNPTQSQTLALNARQTIETTFNRDQNLATLEQTYLQLIKG